MSPVLDHIVGRFDTLDVDSVRDWVIRNPYAIFGSIVAFVVIGVYLVSRNLERDFYDGVEIVKSENTSGSITYSKARKEFSTNARQLLWNGLKSCKGVFQIVTTTGPEVVVPSRYVNDLKNDKRFSFNGFIERDFFVDYPGFEGVRASTRSRIIQDVVRVNLTQSLNLITGDLCEETDLAFNEYLGNSPEWKSIQFMRSCPELVARLSTRVFLGPELARDKTWLKIVVRYTIVLIMTVRGLRMIPEGLRPYLHWILPQNIYLRRLTGQARGLVKKELNKRRAAREERLRNGEKTSKTADSLGWMMDMAEGRTTSDGKPFDYSGAQLGLTFAAIHTTSDLLTKVMYKLVEYPEYIQPLREEMVSILREEGWKKTGLYKMKFLDSFLKETQRLESPSMSVMNRVTTEDVTFSDGSFIPAHASVKVFNDSHFNAETYPDPMRFDPYRYLKMRSQPGQENNWQFVSTSPDSLGFGHGKYACPGRFFASNEVKIALCYLLLRYDWRLEDENKKPKNMDMGLESVGDPWVKIQYRRRQEEVDLNNLAF